VQLGAQVTLTSSSACVVFNCIYNLLYSHELSWALSFNWKKKFPCQWGCQLTGQALQDWAGAQEVGGHLKHKSNGRQRQQQVCSCHSS